MTPRERAENRREMIAWKQNAKRHGVWYSNKYLRKFQRKVNLRANRGILTGIPF